MLRVPVSPRLHGAWCSQPVGTSCLDSHALSDMMVTSVICFLAICVFLGEMPVKTLPFGSSLYILSAHIRCVLSGVLQIVSPVACLVTYWCFCAQKFPFLNSSLSFFLIDYELGSDLRMCIIQCHKDWVLGFLLRLFYVFLRICAWHLNCVICWQVVSDHFSLKSF